MATDIGANIVGDDLIFGLDSSYGVADNSTATRFYPGEPTVNYVSDSPTQGGWSGGIDVLDSSQKKFKCHISNFNGSPGAGWRAFTWDMTAHSGSDVTISLDFETVGPNGTMAWIMVGQTNTHTNNSSGAGGYMGYSATSERTYKTTTSKERVTWTGTIGSTGTASQPSGHIGFTFWINSGVPGNQDAYVILSNVQIEKKNHATPFVNGTRSSTASLIDLKRTADIDVSNVSFDSTGQPTFDGTNDKIVIADQTSIGAYTYETVVKINSSDSAYSGFGSNYKSDASGYSGVGNGWVLRLDPSGGLQVYTKNNSTTLINPINISGFRASNSNKYIHLVYTYSNGTNKLYLNGVLQATGTGLSGTTPSDSTLIIGAYSWGISSQIYYLNGYQPVAKLYNTTFSAEEIKQNYNAYKKRFDL